MGTHIKGKKFRVAKSTLIELACKECAKKYELEFDVNSEVREGVCSACGERKEVAATVATTLDEMEVVK